MYSELLKKATDLPGIVQGALGSFLFWLALQAVQALGMRFVKAGQQFGEIRKIQEHLYRRYTSRDGYVPLAQGTLVSLSFAMRGLLQGLLFCCVALLLGGTSSVVWGICLVAAIYYLGMASLWLIPSSSWNRGSNLENWERVMALERELYGKVDQHVTEVVEKFRTQEENARRASAGS